MRKLILIQIISLIAILTASCISIQRPIASTDLPHDSFLFIIKRVTFSICKSDIEANVLPKDDACSPVGQAAISGSGFVVATNGQDSWGITAGHVCATEKVKLQSPDGKVIEPNVEGYIRVMLLGGVAYNAVVEDIYPSLDMCVLKIAGMVPKQMVEVSERPPIRGERHYVMSAPLGTFGPDLLPTFEGFYNGRTMSYPPPMGGEHLPYGVYTIPTRGGSSGSPILNSQGRLVGVTSGTLVGFENIAFSPPYEGVHAVVEAVKQKASNSLHTPVETDTSVTSQPDTIDSGAK